MVLAAVSNELPRDATEAVSVSEIMKKSAIADRVVDLLAHPAKIRFKDFENEHLSVVGALKDYGNVFVPLTLFGNKFEIEFSLSLLRGMRDLGVPGVVEYFCVKAVAWDVSMDKDGMNAWRSVPARTRAELSWIFQERHLSGFDWRQMGIIDLVEQDACLLDSLLHSEWPDESDKKACRHFIEILGTVAERGIKRMCLLDDSESMEREIERSRKP